MNVNFNSVGWFKLGRGMRDLVWKCGLEWGWDIEFRNNTQDPSATEIKINNFEFYFDFDKPSGVEDEFQETLDDLEIWDMDALVTHCMANDSIAVYDQNENPYSCSRTVIKKDASGNETRWCIDTMDIIHIVTDDISDDVAVIIGEM